MKKSFRHSVWFSIFSLLVLTGCGDNGSRIFSLLDSDADSPGKKGNQTPKPGDGPVVDDAERQRLSELQLVRFVDDGGNEFFMPPGGLYFILTDQDQPYCSFDAMCPGVAQSQNCAWGACNRQVMFCAVRFLQSAALIRAEPLIVPRSYRLKAVPVNEDLDDLDNYDLVEGEIKIPPQSPAARVAILRLAVDITKQGLDQMANVGQCPSPVEFAENGGGFGSDGSWPLPWHTETDMRASGLWAQVTVDGFNLLNELGEDTVDAILAAADSQRSVSTTAAQGAARSIAGSQLSRAEAAHLLIGGSPGILGSTEKAFCSSPELSGSAKTALRLLRRAAPHPDDVLSESVDLATLLNGGFAGFAHGSVKVRLEALDGREIIDSVEASSGLSREDFLQARTYLSQEIRTFARDKTVTFVPEAIGVVPSGVLFYAATGRQPTQLPPEYFAAIARQWWGVGPLYAGRELLTSGSGGQFGDTGLSATLANAYGKVRQAIGLENGQQHMEVFYPGDPTLLQFEGPLTLLASRDGRVGQFGFSWLEFALEGDPNTVFFADGYTSDDGLRVVRGLSGLLCATTGLVEGEPCTAATLTSHTVVAEFLTTFSGGNDLIGKGYVNGNAGYGIVDWDDPTPLFLIKPKSPANAVPGGYDLLGGFTLGGGLAKLDTVGAIEYRFALFPELDRKAGEILRPSEKWCTRSAVECDGTLFDERMPLENELAEDNNGVESSWRHYLTLAEQAAAEAHLLGEQYLQNGLEIDRQLESVQIQEAQDKQRYLDRVSGEVETIQDICGSSMDTTDVLALLGGQAYGPTSGMFCSVPDGQVAEECCNGAVGVLAQCPYKCQSGLCMANACASTGSDSGCPSPYQCIGQRCVISPTLRVEDEQSHREGLSRLRECIGDGKVYDYVALGSEPLCLWDGGAQAPTSLCGGANAEFPCPTGARKLPNGEYDCQVKLPPAQVPNVKLVGARLALADSSVLVGAADPCAILRSFRDPTICIQGQPCAKDNANSAALLDYFAASYTPEFLGQEHISRAKDIGWRAEPPLPNGVGNASSIIVDGNVKWSTRPGSTQWPCADYHPVGSTQPPIQCADWSGLFCQRLANGCAQNDEAQQEAAARLNQRMYEAVMVLKGLADGDFDDIHVPQILPANQLASFGQVIATRDVGNTIEQDYPNGVVRIFSDPTVTGPLPPFWHFIEFRDATLMENKVSFDVPTQNGDLLLRRQVASVATPYPRIAHSALLASLLNVPGSISFSEWSAILGAERPLPFSGTSGTRDAPSLTGKLSYNQGALRDAAEILCEVTRGETWHYDPAECPETDLGSLIAFNNFSGLKRYGACRVNNFNRAVGSMVLARVPFRAIEGVQSFSVSGGFPVVGGQMGAQMLRLRAALTRYGEFTHTMSEQASQLVDTVDHMDFLLQQIGIQSSSDALAIQQAEAQGEIARIQGVQSQVRMSQIEFQKQAAQWKANMDCVQAAAHAAGSLVTSFGASALGAAADCIGAQMDADIEQQNLTYESRIAGLEGDIARIQGEVAGDETLIRENTSLLNQIQHAREMIGLRAQIRGALHSMSSTTREAQAALDEIRASLAEIEVLRLRVHRSINRAMQFESIQAEVTENIDSVLNSKLNVSKKRYLQAHKNAIRLSFLAKRAIEQRLGLHLSELRADMPLVDAPSTWEADVCAAEGIDYEKIRATASENGSTPAVPVDFSGAYIGDYVTKLKNVVESYRLQYDFHEGTDEAVASLRDDILNVRAPCTRFSGNLLKYSGDLDHLVAASAEGGWQIQGCDATEEEGISSTCLAIERRPDLVLPDASGFDLTFGQEATEDTRLAQQVTLKPGKYRVSWYSDMDPNGTVPQADVTVYNMEGDAFTPVSYTDEVTPVKQLWTRPGPIGQWARHYRLVELTQEQPVLVAIRPSNSMLAGPTRAVGGIMLEKITDVEPRTNPQLLAPAPFVATTDSLDTTVPDCQDTTGEVFRQSKWEYRCAKLCPDGFSDNCLDSSLTDNCYWETSFSLDQRELETGRVFKQAGFARGNFNYRIESVGVNFVGTELRDCTGSSLPSTCNAAGYVPYSLKHLGPLFVTNHTGGAFEVKLFNANIEHARGLGIERYLTNPISGTDRELLTPYMRAEFTGRPLDGNFALRVWDDGVDFDAIQDVQLYIKYRYWTRFD